MAVTKRAAAKPIAALKRVESARFAFMKFLTIAGGRLGWAGGIWRELPSLSTA
jgi:hypothetical protein